MRARVFKSEFQISFLIFSHSDDQISLLNAAVGKPISTSLYKKMDGYCGSRYRKVQVWAQGWLGIVCLRLLSLHTIFLVNLAEGTGLFPWGSSRRVGCHWMAATDTHLLCTIFLARGYVLSPGSESPAYLEPCGEVIPHRKAMVMLEVQRKQREQAKIKKSTPLTILTAASDTTEEFLACCQSCVCPWKPHKNTT